MNGNNCQLNPQRRNALIDCLRGFCLVAMTVNHLPHNPLEPFTWQTFGFISAAEGFVFLSGLVTGLVFGRVAISQGMPGVTRRTLRRALTIYLANAGLITFAMLAAKARVAALPNQLEPSLPLWAKTMIFVATPAYTEILRMYCILFLIIPVVFWALINKRLPWVAAASAGLWLLASKGYGTTASPVGGYFDIFSWQLLFVGGICFGFISMQKRTELRTSKLCTAASFAVVAAFFLTRHSHCLTGQELTGYFHWLLTWRQTLSLARLLDFSGFAYLIYRYRQPLNKFVQSVPGQGLAFLGKHSLPVFVWSISATLLVARAEHQWVASSSLDRGIFTLLVVASCFVTAWLHTQWQVVRREGLRALKPRENASPAFVAPDALARAASMYL